MKHFILLVCSGLVLANPIGEELLIKARQQGTVVYLSCIATPPATDAQRAICADLYAQYMATLVLLNAPLPLKFSEDPDPFSSSIYDICRYETGHMVFGDKTVAPYCPTLKKNYYGR